MSRTWGPRDPTADVGSVLLCGSLIGFVAAGAVQPLEAGAGSCAVEPAMYLGPDDDTLDDDDDGVDEDNMWLGQGGGDTLRTLACDDRVLNGGNGIDDVGGGSGEDSVEGGDDRDLVYGGADDDFLHGNSGNDDIYDDQTGDNDVANGEGGNDLVDVQDSDGLDFAGGDAGTDNCRTNPGDIEHSSCES